MAAGGPLSETFVRQILVNLLQVLDYVHSKGIIYRDIKPDNIILRSSNNQPVLIDFGAVKQTMATVLDPHARSMYTMVLGTPGFMAPEQATGRPVYASDIYSLGMTAIYLLTGKIPQELEIDPQTEQILWQQHSLKVSSSLITILNKAIQYQPRDRYTTAIKMLNDLQAASIPPRQPSTVATVVLSPDHKQVSGKPAGSPHAPVIDLSSNKQNWQKNLILGSLLVGGLLSAAVVIGVRNHSPQPSIATSSPPESTSNQPIAQPTPTVAESPNSSVETDRTLPTPVPTSPASPLVDSTPQLENQPQNTESASSSVNSASELENKPQAEDELEDVESEEVRSTQPENQQSAVDSLEQESNDKPNGSTSNAASSIPAFPVGTSERTVKAALGNPTTTSRGIWSNTRAVIYEIKPNQITLGYLFDRTSGRLRQTEVSFAQSVEPEVMQATLQGMLGANTVEINQGLQQVYQRRTNKYSFNTGGLKVAIERNQEDRIYIGVWDADLH